MCFLKSEGKLFGEYLYVADRTKHISFILLYLKQIKHSLKHRCDVEAPFLFYCDLINVILIYECIQMHINIVGIT